MRKSFILVFCYDDTDDYKRITEVEYPLTLSALHDRVSELAGIGHKNFQVDCSAELGKQWSYISVQRPVEMVPEEVKSRFVSKSRSKK